MGIPIEAARGVGGGYRLRPGYRLPPLMFGESEAVAVVLGLLEARAGRLHGSAEPAEAALAKIRRALPPALGRRVAALEATLRITRSSDGEPIRGEVALHLAEAIRRGLRVQFRYRAHDGTPSRRTISPHGLVVHSGFWYLVAHDHDRDAPRIFRVDRIEGVRFQAGVPATPAPPEFDPVAILEQSLASVPGAYRVSVVVELPPEVARTRLPDGIGVLTPVDRGTRLDARIDSLDWIARVLAGLGCPVTITEPPELRERVAELGRLLQESANG